MSNNFLRFLLSLYLREHNVSLRMKENPPKNTYTHLTHVRRATWQPYSYPRRTILRDGYEDSALRTAFATCMPHNSVALTVSGF